MIRTISALCVLSSSWASPAIPAAVANNCSDFSGIWYNNPDITHAIKYNFTLPYGPGTCNVSFGGAGSGVEACHGGSADNAYAVASGDTLTACPKFYDGLVGTLGMATPEDELKWANGAGWFRVHGNHT